jgi:hypothetical protein
MPKKLTCNHVKRMIENCDGYILLSSEYINNHSKLKIRCPDGHEYKATYNDFQAGNRCPLCAKNRKFTYNFIKKHITKEGYILLSEDYKDTHSKLKIKCPKQHIFEMGFNSFKHGQRCSVCYGTPKHTYEFIKEHIEYSGCKLLSKEYKGNKKHLRIQCKNNHIFKMRWDCFQRGQRCKECSIDNTRMKHEYIKEQFEKEGYYLLSCKYKNNHSKLKVQCPIGHKYMTAYQRWYNGNRCPICYAETTSSIPEKEVFEIVKQIYDGGLIANDRTQIINPSTGCGLELDVWLPELRKAIEFNGVYWHSSYYTKRKDKIKKQQCEEKGIDLMIIYDCEWLYGKEKCLNKINKFVGL